VLCDRKKREESKAKVEAKANPYQTIPFHSYNLKGMEKHETQSTRSDPEMMMIMEIKSHVLCIPCHPIHVYLCNNAMPHQPASS